MRPGQQGPGNGEDRLPEAPRDPAFNEAGATRPRKPCTVPLSQPTPSYSFNEAGATRPRKLATPCGSSCST